MTTTLKDMFERAMRRDPSKVAVVVKGSEHTYADLEERSRRFADVLWEVGVRAGDRVALLLGNRVEFVVADLAIARVGAVKVPLNAMLSVADVSYMVDHAEARALVTGSELADIAAGAARTWKNQPTVVFVDDSLPDGLPGQLADEVQRRCQEQNVIDRVRVDPDHGAAIFYTGGTTGRPKGVLHSHRSLATMHLAQIIEAEVAEDERLLVATPLPHAAGLFVQTSLVRGATAHVLDHFDEEAILETVDVAGITWLFLVPTMIYRLLQAPGVDQRRLGTLRTIVYGAAPIAAPQLRQALETFGTVFVQLYGQTECPNWGTRLSKADHQRAAETGDRLGSCGRASILADVQVIDRDGAPLRAGASGEVCLRSPYLLDEYWSDPEATREKFLGDWIRTGDVGYLDDGGYLHLQDRLSDMVISGGMNVYTTEVESVVQSCPGVTQVAVIGVPHDDWGEAVHAVLVVDPSFDEAVLREHCRERLAGYKRPKSLEIVEEFPLTAYGKVDKKALRQRHWQGRDRAIS